MEKEDEANEDHDVDEPGQGIRYETRSRVQHPSIERRTGKENQGKERVKAISVGAHADLGPRMPDMPHASQASRGVYSDLISLLPCFPTLRACSFRPNSHPPYVHVGTSTPSPKLYWQSWVEIGIRMVVQVSTDCVAACPTTGSLSPTPCQPVACGRLVKAGGANGTSLPR